MSLPLPERIEFWTPTDVVNPGMEKHLAFSSRFGALYEGDCLDILPLINDGSIDTVFADPPFNLAKEYGRQVDDCRSDDDYLSWCRHWLDHCVRILKPGGALFVYNLPKWNIHLGSYLAESG